MTKGKKIIESDSEQELDDMSSSEDEESSLDDDEESSNANSSEESDEELEGSDEDDELETPKKKKSKEDTNLDQKSLSRSTHGKNSSQSTTESRESAESKIEPVVVDKKEYHSAPVTISKEIELKTNESSIENDSESVVENPARAEEEDIDEEDNDDDNDVVEETKDEEETEPSVKVHSKVEDCHLDRNSKMLYDYLKKHNRPFGVTDLDRGLSDLNRGQISKSVDKLVDCGLAMQNDKKVVWLNQANFTNMSEKQLENRKQLLDGLSKQEQALRQQLENIQGEIASMRQLPCDSELKPAVERLALKKRELEGRVSQMKPIQKPVQTTTGNNKPVDQLQSEVTFYKSAWRTRKSNVMEVVQDMMESANKKMKLNQYLEEIGIDTDEAAKVDFKSV